MSKTTHSGHANIYVSPDCEVTSLGMESVVCNVSTTERFNQDQTVYSNQNDWLYNQE